VWDTFTRTLHVLARERVLRIAKQKDSRTIYILPHNHLIQLFITLSFVNTHSHSPSLFVFGPFHSIHSLVPPHAHSLTLQEEEEEEEDDEERDQTCWSGHNIKKIISNSNNETTLESHLLGKRSHHY
jgi:hypothetical protein